MITSANAIYQITIPGVFNVPVQLQQFATDDIFDTGAIPAAEVMMGVDGILTAGFVFAPVEQGISLQADSPSIALFETWRSAEVNARDKFPAQAVIVLTTLNTKWALTKGFLRNFPPMPDAKRVLQPRKFSITWEAVSPALTA